MIPALLIAYSALVDPLINFNLDAGFKYGGIQVADESKARGLTRILMPALLALSLTLALMARPVVSRNLRIIAMPAIAFLVLALVSALWSRSASTTLNLAAYQAILYSTLLCSVAVADNVQRVIHWLLLAFAVVVMANLVAIVSIPGTEIGHAGIYPHKNTLGSAAGCAFIIGLFSLRDGRLFSRSAALFTTLGAVVMIWASDSKTATALVFAAPAMAIATYVTVRLTGLGTLASLTLLALAGCSAIILIGTTQDLVLDDYLRLGFGDPTFTGRTYIWGFIYDHVQNAPILGNGYRGFWGLDGASPQYGSEIEFIRTIGSSHNGFLEIALDLGIAGSVLLITLILMTIHMIGKQFASSTAHGLMFLSLAFFVIGRNGMESVILWSSFFDNLLFLLVGMLAACRMQPAYRPAPSFGAAR